MMFFSNDKIELCSHCHEPIYSDKFINKTYYFADKKYLVRILNGEASLAACDECLKTYVRSRKKSVFRYSIGHRDLYLFKPTLFERFKKLLRFASKQKEGNDEITQQGNATREPGTKS